MVFGTVSCMSMIQGCPHREVSRYFHEVKEGEKMQSPFRPRLACNDLNGIYL